jgi:tRNA(Ile)-lysidine synthase
MAGTGGLSPGAEGVLAAVGGGLPDAPLVVALGGGADSAVCAWAASALGRRVRTATVDHGLPASPGLIAAARAAAEFLGLDHRLLPAPAADDSEATLRAVRYAALEAGAVPGEVIVTGHTRDDQAETVLGNLLRGAGAGGLAGIPERRGRWCRPLMGVSRAEARAVADDLGLPYTDDPGNRDQARRRNLLRHRVIPLLEESLGPGVRAALARAASLLSADDALLRSAAEQVPLYVEGGVVRLPAAVLATLPVPVASRAARRALRRLLDPYPGTGADVEAVLSVAGSNEGARSLQGGHLAERQGPWVVLRPAGSSPPPAPLALPVPGRVSFGGWVLSAEPPGPRPSPEPVGRRHTLLDPEAAGRGLVVRAAAAGDRVDAGQGGQPVREALRAAGVPAGARAEWPVVEAGGTIAWVPGARRAAWAAPRGGGVVLLRLREAR